MPGVEEFIGPHERDKILCIREIDNIVGIAREHVNGLDSITGYLKLDHFVRPDLPLLNQAVTGDDDKELPFAVVPVLALGDAGFGDIDAELAVIRGLH